MYDAFTASVEEAIVLGVKPLHDRTGVLPVLQHRLNPPVGLLLSRRSAGRQLVVVVTQGSVDTTPARQKTSALLSRFQLQSQIRSRFPSRCGPVLAPNASAALRMRNGLRAILGGTREEAA